MYTAAAARSLPFSTTQSVVSRHQLYCAGWTESQIRSQLRARRWQQVGRAIVLHNGSLSRTELRDVALIVLGPRCMTTSFTALEDRGLTGWERDELHILVPRGARVVRPPELSLRVHYTDRWERHVADPSAVSGLAQAAALAASGFRNARPACGLLAATVQQRLLRPADLVRALDAQPRLRHRSALIMAVHDIAQGSQALSEIDFARLCRRLELPAPVRQSVRNLPNGARRYVDAEWRSRSGRRIVAEVDGALHLVAKRWWEDQLRQNELAIAGDTILRFPSVVFRHEQRLVAGQIARALDL